MLNPQIKISQSVLFTSSHESEGEFVKIEGETFYQISHYDQMRPFFMSLVSDTDQWLFISSSGGLTAGRKNPENALFPYYTDDKIQDSHELTGSKTIILATKDGETFLWEPFSDRYEGLYQIERNLYKNQYGNRLIFEEHNRDLGLSFTYGWSFSQQYGFVKKSQLSNNGRGSVQVRILDGLQNLLPYGVDYKMQAERSTLLDAYKKNELLEKSGLGLFLLSSVPVDKAEPSEALKATTVWQTGLTAELHLLSSKQLSSFRKGLEVTAEVDVRAERGAYFVQSTFSLMADQTNTWYFAAELNQGPSEVFKLHEWLQTSTARESALVDSIKSGTDRLVNIVAAADGLQISADRMLTTRHFANVLFNVMRGGIFDHHYDVQRDDVIEFIENSNRELAKRQKSFLHNLPTTLSYMELKRLSAQTRDTDFQRLGLEYLPLTFSRRHGDPSRPWNQFSIELQDEAGKKTFYYQGNWRDIFQNWEALAISYPRFLESMITKFVNASTVDGYNPYRITRDGIDWELIEKDDPWSYIGYWGDHQIIYLLKLMELSEKHHPGELEEMLIQRIYTYADVPYRIKDYANLLANPHDTIDFDHSHQDTVDKRVEQIGSDGKLVQNSSGTIYYVTLSEKLLVALLAKLSNFIPEGGIWLNTQRPEWNDANNALVGYGISMVTLCYIRRYVAFVSSLFERLKVDSIDVSEELCDLFEAVARIFKEHRNSLGQPTTKLQRRHMMDDLGKAGSLYRKCVYKGFSEKQSTLTIKNLQSCFGDVLACVDHTILANRRDDGLYHAYNLLHLESNGEVGIRHLYEMLEGQVAVLSAGVLSAQEASDVLQALRVSQLYRADQHSYILYPDRNLPRFEDKNSIPGALINKSTFLQNMIEKGDRRLIEKDVTGTYHFNGNFHNQKDLEQALEGVCREDGLDLDPSESRQILDMFETVFDHQSFTGRSGTFFGYEGLGCIYWHMVSKLLLAAEEVCIDAMNTDVDQALIDQLIRQYYDIREGIGFNKSPAVYGAFPTDPYSHTPGHAGARQPGMTGQVKEDFLARFGELGVTVSGGQIAFVPKILKHSEFITKSSVFTYRNLQGQEQHLNLPPSSMAFTYCQVPVIYTIGNEATMTLTLGDEKTIELDEYKLNKTWSDALFNRTGEVKQIHVVFDPNQTEFIG